MVIRQEQTEKEVHCGAFVNGARNYCSAADLLLRMRQTAAVSLDPIYMLYFHAAELALKGFLRFRGNETDALKAGWKHNLEKLHADARASGLDPEPADALDLQNVVHLLYSGNKQEAFRYFTWESRVMPDIEWASKIVNTLVALVEKRTGQTTGKPGPAVKINVVIGQPVSKSSDV
jgi:hypothetical protein